MIIDIKNVMEVMYKDMGVDIIQTKYFLKKDCYSFIINRQLTTIMMCMVNQRIILSSKDTIVTDQNINIEEISHGMFNITCSGAALSKDKDLVAIGDFTGHIKVFSTQQNHEVVAETTIKD